MTVDTMLPKKYLVVYQFFASFLVHRRLFPAATQSRLVAATIDSSIIV